MVKILAIIKQKADQESLENIVSLSLPEAVMVISGSLSSGLKQARSENPDLILLDSYFLLKDKKFSSAGIKGDILLSLIPLVIVSGSKQEAGKLIEELKIDADYFLCRPVCGEDMLMLVSSVMQMRTRLNQMQKDKDILKQKVRDHSRKLKDEQEQRKIKENELKKSYLKQEKSRLAVLNLMEDFTSEFEKHKKSRDELLEREKKYMELLTLFRSITDNMTDMLWAKDLDNRYVYTNKAMCEKLLNATDTEEPVGKTDMFFAMRERANHPENNKWHTFGEICRDSDKIILENKKPAHFDEYGNVKGKFLYLDVRKSPLFNEKGVMMGTVGSGRDITQEYEIRQQLVESEKRLRQAQIISGLGSYLFDIKSGKWECSEILNMIFGIGDAFEYNFGGWVSILHPDHREQMTSYFQDEVLGNKTMFDKEYKIIRINDKAERWVHGVGKLEFGSDGEPISMHGTIQDITSQKQIQEEIEKLNNELENRVKERTSQLEAANKELEAFSYSVSHDLRAPLRAIHGFTQILIEDYNAFIDEEGKRICTVIMDNAVQMGKLVDDLLKFSRLNRTDIHFYEIDMNGLTRNIFKELTTHEKRQAIDLNIAELHTGWGDPNLIRQVWVNLISNALKFTSYADNVRINILSRKEVDAIVYSISDNGAGFNMKYMDKLFGVFQRLHSAREFEGTGVGLAIVQRIIHRHGGRVWAHGEVNKGATFYFSLPNKQ